jgi:hypothetical protein
MDTTTLIEDLEEAQRLLQKKFPPDQFGEDGEVEIIWNALEQAKNILIGQMSSENNDLAEYKTKDVE